MKKSKQLHAGTIRAYDAQTGTDTQTLYTCSVRWSLPPDIQNMLSIMGKAQDAKIAETMLQQKNGRRRRHLSDSDGLYRLSDSARMPMVQQSSWFGVFIETSSIVMATSM